MRKYAPPPSTPWLILTGEIVSHTKLADAVVAAWYSHMGNRLLFPFHRDASVRFLPRTEVHGIINILIILSLFRNHLKDRISFLIMESLFESNLKFGYG